MFELNWMTIFWPFLFNAAVIVWAKWQVRDLQLSELSYIGNIYWSAFDASPLHRAFTCFFLVARYVCHHPIRYIIQPPRILLPVRPIWTLLSFGCWHWHCTRYRNKLSRNRPIPPTLNWIHCRWSSNFIIWLRNLGIVCVEWFSNGLVCFIPICPASI